MSSLRLVSLVVAVSLFAVACGTTGSSSSASRSAPASPDSAPTVISTTATVAPQPTSEDSLVLVELISLQPGAHETALTGYLHDLDGLVNHAGVELLGPPIEVVDPLLDNAALPASVVELDADFVVMVRFADAASQQAFEVNSTGLRTEWSESLDFDLRAISAGGFGLPLPGTQPARPAPAFYLINMFGPQTPDQRVEFLDYVAQASPLAASQGTAFFDGLVFVDVLTGESPFVTIGLTEWTSRDTFHAFHAEPAFLDLVETRNAAVTSFVEAGGKARDDLLPKG